MFNTFVEYFRYSVLSTLGKVNVKTVWNTFGSVGPTFLVLYY